MNRLGEDLRNPEGNVRMHAMAPGNLLNRFRLNPNTPVTIRDNERTVIENNLQAHQNEFEEPVVVVNPDESDDAPGAGAIRRSSGEIVLQSGSGNCPGINNHAHETQEINPLSIMLAVPPEVLEHVLSFLSLENLKNLRNILQEASDNPEILKILKIVNNYLITRAGQIPTEHYQLLSIPFDDIEAQNARQELSNRWLNHPQGSQYYREIVINIINQSRRDKSFGVETIQTLLEAAKCDPLALFLYWLHAPMIIPEAGPYIIESLLNIAVDQDGAISLEKNAVLSTTCNAV